MDAARDGTEGYNPAHGGYGVPPSAEVLAHVPFDDTFGPEDVI